MEHESKSPESVEEGNQIASRFVDGYVVVAFDSQNSGKKSSHR